MTSHPALVRSRTGVLVVDTLTGVVLLAATLALGPLIGGGDAVIVPGVFPALIAAATIMVGAVAVRRLHPGWALGLAWASTLVHMLAGLDAGVAQLGILVVLASAAHYGSRRVLRLSGFSVPIGAVVAVLYLLLTDSWLVRLFTSTPLVPSWLPFAVLMAFLALVLAVPWLVGLLARTLRLNREGRERAAQAEAEARRAHELAELQAARTGLARDVHDIVGHSLAVIVAQAESVRFRDVDDLEAVHGTVATIADTARRALGEVRQVLESTDSGVTAPSSPAVDLDRLIADLAASRAGTKVELHGDGAQPTGSAAVALYRATQELLTNALRHGDAERPLTIEVEHGEAETSVTVENSILAASRATTRAGTGVEGARARLAGVGGALEVVEIDGRYRTTARVPVAAGQS